MNKCNKMTKQSKKMVLLIVLLLLIPNGFGILYPRNSETRNSITLNGLWDFTQTKSSNIYKGFKQAGIDQKYILKMPVPASYNDITVDYNLQQYVGKVYYEKKFFIPSSWRGQRIWIRFGSVCYSANVYLNGQLIVSHQIGHLPFTGEITLNVKFDEENLILVEVDNTLTNTTIPQGETIKLNSGRIKQTYTFDFFNYAGIDRPVIIYATPQIFIEDLTVITTFNDTDGLIDFQAFLNGDTLGLQFEVHLFDRDNKEVASQMGYWDQFNTLVVGNPKLWWPFQMDDNPGYLYTLKVELHEFNGELVDVYRLPVGIRTVTWNNTTLLINNRPLYLRGFGKHEDSDIRGKGLDLSLILRDYNLIRWIGANVYRTSHYPYADEIMDLADETGIMIIDECPAVNMEYFSDELLTNHKQSINEMIARDKNHPSILMWSLANEPRTQYNQSEDYFKEIFRYARTLDTTRPFTIVNNQRADVDHSGQFADILGFNIYLGWYANIGDLDAISSNITDEITKWNTIHQKPVYVSEFGAETLNGLHSLPSTAFSEEYQIDFLSTYFKVFDQLRSKGWFIGELIWNFADFGTAQSTSRVGGNRKGLFTRNRQPKASAHVVRNRYWNLAKILDKATLPDDIYRYIVKNDEF